MRAYFLNNMYLSSIQNGIQSAHVIHEMFRKYDAFEKSSVEVQMLNDWADNHKTMIVLNGGMTPDLEIALENVEKSGFPFAVFYEPGIGNALTSIGVIIPESVYNLNIEELMDDTTFYKESWWDMIVAMKNCQLAK